MKRDDSNYWLRGLAAIILGVFTGASFTMTVCGRRVEGLTIERNRLNMELKEAQENLNKLSEGLSRKRYAVVETVELVLEGVEGSEREDLEKLLRRKLQVFIGKELDGLDPDVVMEVFRGVTMNSGDKVYTILPIQIVIARHAFFRVEGSEMMKKPIGRE